MIKKYNIDELWYDKEAKKMVLSGWILIDKLSSINLYIYKDEEIYEEITLGNVRKDVINAHRANISKDKSVIAFFSETEINLSGEHTYSLVLNDNGIIQKLETFLIEKILETKTIIFSVDYINYYKGEVLIKGWAFSKYIEQVKISCNANYTIKYHSRYDVHEAIKSCKNPENVGFEITINKKRGSVILGFDDGVSLINKKINISRLVLKKVLNTSKKILSLVKIINISNIKRSIAFIKKNGLNEFLFKFKYLILSKFNQVDSQTLYRKWFISNALTDFEIENQKKFKFNYQPKISIIVPTYNTPKTFLIEMIESVINQTYSNWELCIADGASKNLEVLSTLSEYEKKDARVKVIYLKENYKISGNTNEALKLATGDYVALFDHDDLITRNALYEVVKAINENETPDFIYTDEDKVDSNGINNFDASFKPDFSMQFLRSNNYICHFSVFKRDLLDKIGYFNSEYDGAQDYDMILRITEQTDKIVHIPKILYHWRVHENSTAASSGSKTYTVQSGKKALEAHLSRMNIKGKVYEAEFAPNFFKIEYDLFKTPLVSIVIANKDHKEDLKRCLDSLKKSSYKNYEIIIVENNSSDNEIFEYYSEITKDGNIRVVNWRETGFNYSSINNLGVRESKGEYIILLNNDTEVINDNWIEELLSIAQFDNVGIVGAKLYYPDDTIQHAGVVIGMLGIAGHVYNGCFREDTGIFGRLKVRQNVSAVTAAVLMIKKSVYLEVEGLDEEMFKVAFNDIDLCMKVISAGYEIIWTPYSELYHYESKSRGSENTPEKYKRFQNEIRNFDKKWGMWLKDPFYNENLDLLKTYPVVKQED